MPRNGSGQYQLPAGNPVVPNTVIQSSWANNSLGDIATALTQSISYDGQTVPVSNLPMGGFKHLAVGNATLRNEYGTAGQVQDSSLTLLTAVAGANVITANLVPAPPTYVTGQVFSFVAAATNTSNVVTLNINGLGAKNLTKLGANPLDIGDLVAGTTYRAFYDGVQFQVMGISTRFTGLKNQFINGQFTISQRGTSLVVGTGVRYLLDRWLTDSTGSTNTPSRQTFAAGQTDVPFSPIAFERVVVASVAGAGNFALFSQRVEFVEASQNQRMTLSFWAKADSNKNIAVEGIQNFGGGGSAAVFGISVTTCALTNLWQKFTVPMTFPSTTGKTVGTSNFYQIAFWMDAGSNFNARTNTLGQQSGTFDYANMQIEFGTIATDYDKREVGVEFIQCERFYERGDGALFAVSTGAGQLVGPRVYYMTSKRTTPTVNILGNNNSAGIAATNSATEISDRSFMLTNTTTAAAAFQMRSTFEASSEL